MKEPWTYIDLNLIEESGKILAAALEFSISLVEDRRSAYDVDLEIERFILAAGAVPSFKGFNGFPNASCISINDEVVHGIPLKDDIFHVGDLVTIDIGVGLGGNYTDAARTVVVGGGHSDLVEITKEALDAAISVAKVGETIGTIGFMIQLTAEMSGYNVPVHFGGHGIGISPHMWPFIPNYGVRGSGVPIEEGMCLAVEPILFAGDNAVEQDDDGWTIRSTSKILSAHFEDTIYVSSESSKVLTRPGD